MAENTVPPIPGAANHFAPEPLDYICDLEEPLSRIHDLLTGLMYLGQTLNDGGDAVSRIAEIARDECEKSAELRTKLFHDLHPNNQKEVAQ